MLDFTAASEAVPSSLLATARQEQRRDDPYRPAYHFLPPANWMNDPNGLIYWKGEYHLFYQYNPNGPQWGTIHWGHAVSADLVHWRDLPVALTPTPGGADQDGCWSGCIVDNAGVPSLFYTGVRGEAQLPCLATSRDDLYSWEKYAGNPVLSELPPGLELVAFRDPAVWREGEDWYMLVGSGIKEVGGSALLFRSTNLTEWTYLHPLQAGDITRREPLWTGSLWECPQLVRLGGKHLLTFGVWHERPRYSAFQLGTYQNGRFEVESEGKLDFGDEYFYAPQTLIDPTGRAIMWGWIAEHDSEAGLSNRNWAGVMSLPRVLSTRPDGMLGIEPAVELKALRGKHYHFDQFYLPSSVQPSLDKVQGDCLEIVIEATVEADTRLVVGVRCSPDGEEQTLVSYDHARQWLEIETKYATTPNSEGYLERRGYTLALARDEKLSLHIFVDHSMIEVFANKQACLTSRMYPRRADSLGIAVMVEGKKGVNIKKLDVWELASIWEA